MAKIWLLVVAALFWASGGMAAERIEVGGLAFAVPEGWRVLPPGSPMRKAELQAPGGGGVTFFHFGRQQGGTAEANIERWIRQFQEPPEVLQPRREVKRLGAIVVHHFRASGTYLSGMPGGPTTPQPGHSLVAAAIEGPEGNVFVRLVGPDAATLPLEAAFRRMIEDAAQTTR
ncbi:MAG: hypothetical protein FJX68_11555 [Alphaproteobacteria bacterium]|nr:hypothetical protein [Alphaproteobacteria bacterium]